MNDKDHLSSWVTDLIGRCIEDIEKTKSFALNIFSFLNYQYRLLLYHPHSQMNAFTRGFSTFCD